MDLTKLSRGELQKLAKIHNIRGTLKTSELVKELESVINKADHLPNIIDKNDYVSNSVSVIKEEVIAEATEYTKGWRYIFLLLCLLGSFFFVSGFYLSGLENLICIGGR